MELVDLKKRIQHHLTDGLVIIVGSGLSAAEGIPGMPELSQYLLSVIPEKLSSESKSTWGKIAQELGSGSDLESALLLHPPDPALEEIIAEATADLISLAEARVFEETIDGQRTLRFSRLCDHLLKQPSGIPVVTTNYDRLIELAAEMSGLRVDTLFVGHRAGWFSPRESAYSHCRNVIERKVGGKRKPTLDYAPHIRLLKPHGSLDWYRSGKGPVACSYPLRRQRLVITPGANKYRGGYEPPFDAHREMANRAIDQASRFLVIGYGFNDEHLQTHLQPKLCDGKPAVLLTRTLSEKVQGLIRRWPGMTALSRGENGYGTTVTTQSEVCVFPDVDLWDLGSLVDEVLTP